MVGAAGTLAVLVRVTRPFDGPPAGSSLSLVPLVLWVVSPYLGLVALARFLARSAAQAWVASVGSLAVTAFGLLVLVDGLVLKENLVNTLLLIAVPWLQWGGTLLVAVVVLVLRLAAHRAARGG